MSIVNRTDPIVQRDTILKLLNLVDLYFPSLATGNILFGNSFHVPGWQSLLIGQPGKITIKTAMKRHMKPTESNTNQSVLRRQLLKASSLGIAVLLGGPRALAASAGSGSATALFTGRIIGLTTVDSYDDSVSASEILSLDLSNDLHQLSPLDQYRDGHTLIPLPNGEYFTVPYADEDVPCLFLDSQFQIVAELFAPERHGFGGHAVLLPDNKTLFTHFNKMGRRRGRTANDTGRHCLIDVASRKVIQSTRSGILHGHDIIITRDQQTIILADDGNIDTPVPENSPYTVISHTPCLHLFDAKTLQKRRTVALTINGSLVHIEEGEDLRIYGGTEQFVVRDEAGRAILDSLLGDKSSAYIASIPEHNFPTKIPLPGPLIGVNLDTLQVMATTSVEHADPFDIRLNQQTGLLFCLFSSSNQLARYNPENHSWSYFATGDFNIVEPFGLIEIPDSPYMVMNGYLQGITIFNAVTMNMERHFPIPTHGLKHMLYVA